MHPNSLRKGGRGDIDPSQGRLAQPRRRHARREEHFDAAIHVVGLVDIDIDPK